MISDIRTFSDIQNDSLKQAIQCRTRHLIKARNYSTLVKLVKACIETINSPHLCLQEWHTLQETLQRQGTVTAGTYNKIAKRKTDPRI
jgi:hypothetical protein